MLVRSCDVKIRHYAPYSYHDGPSAAFTSAYTRETDGVAALTMEELGEWCLHRLRDKRDDVAPYASVGPQKATGSHGWRLTTDH
jgi:hypothetical protein